MTPAEFNAALLSLHLDQGHAAEVLGVARRSVARYAKGQGPGCGIPAPVSKLLRLMLAGKMTADEVMEA